MNNIARYLPILDWGRRYDRSALSSDLVAALIVTIMLIPQSLAYALLAGLPPEAGLYASIAPIILYAIFGTSRALAVGPVAVVSLMTAAALSQIAEQGSMGYAVAALSLAALSGLMLLAMGMFRLGFVANFLSHPVIAGFITASGIIIAASQLKHILGIDAAGHNLLTLILSLAEHIGDTNWITVVLGVSATGFLFWVRKGLAPLLRKLGVGKSRAGVLVKTGPANPRLSGASIRVRACLSGSGTWARSPCSATGFCTGVASKGSPVRSAGCDPAAQSRTRSRVPSCEALSTTAMRKATSDEAKSVSRQGRMTSEELNVTITTPRQAGGGTGSVIGMNSPQLTQWAGFDAAPAMRTLYCCADTSPLSLWPCAEFP